MSASEEGGKKADSYRWNSRRLASLPRTGSGPERHIDRGHTPWCSELLMRNTLFFIITDLALWRKKFKCSVAAAQPRCPTLLHGKDGKQTHKHTRASKQTNPLKRIAVFIVPIVDFYQLLVNSNVLLTCIFISISCISLYTRFGDANVCSSCQRSLSKLNRLQARLNHHQFPALLVLLGSVTLCVTPTAQ